MEPNWATHAEFGEALRDAAQAGVQALAVDCNVTENSITAADSVEVRLYKHCQLGRADLENF
jgi:sugar fermentation stimulation protein A